MMTEGAWILGHVVVVHSQLTKLANNHLETQQVSMEGYVIDINFFGSSLRHPSSGKSV